MKTTGLSNLKKNFLLPVQYDEVVYPSAKIVPVFYLVALHNILNIIIFINYYQITLDKVKIYQYYISNNKISFRTGSFLFSSL